MTPEKLMDAMDLLPNDLLEETNALRQKKHVPWKSLTALAACLCLVAGLWFAFPGAKTADSAASGTAENSAGIESVEDVFETVADDAGVTADQQQSSTGSCIALCLDREFTVDQVYEDHITACLDGKEDFSVIIGFENLQKLPKLKSGQRIRVYWEVGSSEIGDDWEIAPYKIEIPEEEQLKKLLIGIGAAVLLAAVCVAAWLINKRIHPNCDCWGPQICDCGPTVVVDEENTQEHKTE